MTSPEEKTDPHASSPPPSLSGEQKFEDTLRNLLKDELKPIVNLQLAQDAEQKRTDKRLSRLELSHFVTPIALSTTALLVSVLAIALTVHTAIALGLW